MREPNILKDVDQLRIFIPNDFATLLATGDLEGPVLTFVARAGRILADNKLPFFPAYTDHGLDHINRVLADEIALVSTEVLRDSAKRLGPLHDVDAAVIVCATVLHDSRHLSVAAER